MKQNGSVSQMDIDHLAIIRKSVSDFLKYSSARYAKTSGLLLDIAPQIHEGARPYFLDHIKIETLDIDPKTRSTYTADLCDCRNKVPECTFDYIVCTEVLEHTRQPFKATETLLRLLRPGGLCFVTTPYNFRIHGPLPDCWRFTEHGLRELFVAFEIIELSAIETLDRFLMPVHYRLVAKKPEL